MSKTPDTLLSAVLARAMRDGDWCQTFSGVAFFPFDPRVSEVRIEDIAHSLALQCRFAGHCRVPYSVAEHSTRVGRLFEQLHPDAAPELILGAHMHDGTEGMYLPDLPRPVKHDPRMLAYRDAEHAAEFVLSRAFGLDHTVFSTPWVKEVDHILLMTEARDLMAVPALTWKDSHVAPLPERIEPWGWERAEREFLARFEELMARRTP